jgi:uncharacterized protein YjiK
MALSAVCASCAPGDAAAREGSPELAAREARLADSLSKRGSASPSETPVAQWFLPPQLREISGLGLTPDGRLFTHGDETGQLTEIDYRRGVAVKQFSIGKRAVRDDFEGITIVNDVFYMITSNGNIYEFREGKNGEQVDYVLHDTHLGKECEFEGLTHEPATNSLLLACKNVLISDSTDQVMIYKWKIGSAIPDGLTSLAIPRATVIGTNKWEKFRPSDITIDPVTGNYVIVSSQERAIAQITPTGEVVYARPLPEDHPQAEGVAITRDSILLISDELNNRPASITLYRWPYPVVAVPETVLPAPALQRAR